MSEIVRCSKCIVPASLPSVTLDSKGVCNFCRRFDELDSRMGSDYFEKKTKQFESIVARVKKLNKKYDCLIPLSGGKDSTYALYLCSKVYKLKCLCYTFNNGFLSEYAKKNIENATNIAGADHFYFAPNFDKLLKYYRLFINKCGNLCPVCMRGIQAGGQMIYDQFRPPLMISGTGRRITYLGIVPEIFQGGDLSFFKNIIKGETLGDELKSLRASPFTRQFNKAKEQLFRLIRLNVKMLGAYTYFIDLYDYIEPSFNDIKGTIEKEMGWQSPATEFEHMDCLLHEIPQYIQTIRFPELSTVTLYHSNLIRLALMSRDDALNIEKSIRGKTKEPEILESFLKQIRMSKEEFIASVKDWRLTDRYRNKTDIKIRKAYRRLVGKS